MQKFDRTSYCGKITENLLGQEVTVAGWVHRRRDHGGLIFVDLRDRSGLVQIVFNPDFAKNVHEIAHTLRSEYVVWIKGKIIPRTLETVNNDLATGKVEIQASELKIFSKSKTPPFALDDSNVNIDEELRLKYRYLDLRRDEMQKRLAFRDKVSFLIQPIIFPAGIYPLNLKLLVVFHLIVNFII